MTVTSNVVPVSDRLAAKYAALRAAGVTGVRVGSFGVPYAAVHEFGFKGVVQVPSHRRDIKQAFGRPIEPKSITVKAHSRRMNVRKRPFLSPALKLRRDMILQIFSDQMAKDSLNLEKAFVRIGNILQTEIVRQIRSQRLINTGNLINSIRYELMRT